MSIQIKFGPGNVVTKDASSYATTADIARDAALYQVLGASQEATEIRINGLAGELPVADGDIIELQTKSHTKGC